MIQQNPKVSDVLTTLQRGESLQTNREKACGQILFCDGCCCGRTDRGYPSLPKQQIKAEWKARKLNEQIQLTISGCLGPCDLANVVCLLNADGEMTWLGGLTEAWQYEALIQWAIACKTAEAWQPLPAKLLPHRFERFSSSS